MSTLPEAKNEILQRIGQVASAEELAEILQSLEARHPSEPSPMNGPAFDPLAAEEEDLLGPVQRSNRSWGGLAAGALLLVALAGAFLWYQRPSSTSEPPAPPAFAPPAPSENAAVPPLPEPDAPPPAEPEIFEEMPAEPEPAPDLQELMQIAEAPEPRENASPAAPEPVPPSVPVSAVRRPVPSGPPAERMAGVLRPGPGVEMPVPLELPAVRYPTAARGQGIKVDVRLDLLVDEEGRVIDALVREGDTSGLGFNEAAVNAARRTRFQPATRWDLPGKAWTELIIEFQPALVPEPGR